MNFRRFPFQFSSTDPAQRQAELQKRFGLPAKAESNMFVDFATPRSVSPGPRENSSTSSPRLQHRVPIFYEGTSEPVKTSVDSMASPETSRKPHIRIVPIEIEGEDGPSKRHKTFSASSSSTQDSPLQNLIEDERKPLVSPKTKFLNGPRVCNIPIKIEDKNQAKKPKNSASKVDSEMAFYTEPVIPDPATKSKQSAPKHNGCNASKDVAKPPAKPKPVDPAAESLKNITGILGKLEKYQTEVEKFSGTVKQKMYRYLDEMLTRLMLELDDIDSMGNEEVRLSRKAAIKTVQASIDMLESKVIRNAAVNPAVEMPAEDIEMKTDSAEDPNTMIIEDVSDNNSAFAKETSELSLRITEEISSNIDDKPEDIEMDCKVSDSQASKELGDSKAMEVDELRESEPIIEEPDSSDELKVEAKLDLTSKEGKPELVDLLTDCEESKPVVTELESDSDSHCSGSHIEDSTVGDVSPKEGLRTVDSSELSIGCDVESNS